MLSSQQTTIQQVGLDLSLFICPSLRLGMAVPPKSNINHEGSEGLPDDVCWGGRHWSLFWGGVLMVL